MPEIRLESYTIRSHGFQVARFHMHDWLILILLGAIELGLNVIEPFHRFVGQDIATGLTYPYNAHTTIPFWVVPMYAVFLPLAIFAVYYFYRRDVYDLHHAILGLLFTVIITGVITDATKDAVGRPRPDFFWRCFPDGKDVYNPKTKNVICSGDKKVIKEGYKSFPSGHTSWSFAGLTFLAWYLSGKIRVFDRRGRVAKLCVIFLPLYAAALVGISLIDDYWHHWQDVLVGALIGMTVSSFCYLHFFPPPYDTDGADCMDQTRIVVSSFTYISLLALCCITIPNSIASKTESVSCSFDWYWSSYCLGLRCIVGWGPYAYFQALAERGRAGEVSTLNSHSFRPSETETTYMRSEHGRDRAEANAYDSNSVLDQMEAGRRN